MIFLKNIFLLFIFVIYCNGAKLQNKNFVLLHSWVNLNFSFPTEQDKQIAIENGFYIKGKAIPVDLEIEYGDNGFHRTFLAIPRLENGIPYSLAIVSNKSNQDVINPEIEPYPNYDWHLNNGSYCKGIASAIRLFIDSCWRLWVIDSGQINAIQRCPPQILAFDLVTDKLEHQYIIPLEVYLPGISVFTAATVGTDVGNGTDNQCKNAHVYIADPWGYGLIIYDSSLQRSWRIEHDYMRPDPELEKFNSAIDGIFTVTLNPPTEKVRMLYFHSLNSYKEITVPLNILNNETLWKINPEKAANAFKILGDRGIQCESEVMDNAGNLFCSIISYNALIRWKNNTEYSADSLDVVGYHPNQFQFVTGLKINKNSQDQDELWALSNTPKIFSGGETKEDEIKFQIFGCRTSDLINKRDCTVAATDLI